MMFEGPFGLRQQKTEPDIFSIEFSPIFATILLVYIGIITSKAENP